MDLQAGSCHPGTQRVNVTYVPVPAAQTGVSKW